jgi:hypothetical protein
VYANAGALPQAPFVVVTGTPSVALPASSGRAVANGASEPNISP